MNKQKAPTPVGSSDVLGDGSKYLEVEITRTQSTLVFLKVPKDFNANACVNLDKILAAAAEETCCESDWDSDQWQDTVEWQAIKEVPKATAEQYEMYDVMVTSPNDPKLSHGHREPASETQKPL